MKTFGYCFKQGLKNVIQNKLFSLAAIGTIATCLFLLGISYALLSNFQNIMYQAESNVGLSVFFEQNTSAKEIDEIGEKIREFDGIEEVIYISADEAWEKFQKDMYKGKAKLKDTFGKDNPLEDSASYEVHITDVSVQHALAAKIKKIDGVRKVNGADTVTKGLSNINMLVGYVSVSIILLLLLVSLFLISTAVATGIRVRKHEIAIIKMIGATDAFIRIPFLVEGVVMGLIGAVLPMGILWLLYGNLVDFVMEHFTALAKWMHFVSPGREFMVLVPMFLIVGVGIGFVGSVLSVRKHLQDLDVNN